MSEKIIQLEKGIFVCDSGIIGPTTTIMVGVHGNETTGIEALDEIIDSINIDTGKVYFIYANLLAIEKNVRFTEKNLNRCFLKGQECTTYEEKRAKEIMKYLDKSDYLLDVHNTTSTNSSIEMLITSNIEYAKYFNIEKVVSNIDDIQKGGSDGYMDNIGKKGFCIECGSINFGDKELARKLAKKSIYNFLKVTGNVNGMPEIYDRDRLCIKMQLMYKTKTSDFELCKEFNDFEFINSGENIGFDGGIAITAEKDSYILFAHSPKIEGSEAFCLGIEIVE